MPIAVLVSYKAHDYLQGLAGNVHQRKAFHDPQHTLMMIQSSSVSEPQFWVMFEGR